MRGQFRNSQSKDVLFSILFNKIENYYGPSNQLIESIIQREAIGDTYFGNNIAIPHPITPISDETFVALAILDRPIEWRNNNYVQIIMIVSIEKNNSTAFQLWHYLSLLTANEESIKQIIKEPCYEQFVQTLKNSLI